jgi:hypothetical protein
VRRDEFEGWAEARLKQLERAEEVLCPEAESYLIPAMQQDQALLKALSVLIKPIRRLEPISMPCSVVLPPCF